MDAAAEEAISYNFRIILIIKKIKALAYEFDATVVVSSIPRSEI